MIAHEGGGASATSEKLLVAVIAVVTDVVGLAISILSAVVQAESPSDLPIKGIHLKGQGLKTGRHGRRRGGRGTAAMVYYLM